MFMPLFAFRKLHVQGLEQSTLADDARRVGEAHHIVIAGDPEPDRNSFTRTDQYSFVQAGVPALAMKFGWEPGSPEYHMWRDWLRGSVPLDAGRFEPAGGSGGGGAVQFLFCGFGAGGGERSGDAALSGVEFLSAV